jgi:hypothetical protein
MHIIIQAVALAQTSVFAYVGGTALFLARFEYETGIEFPSMPVIVAGVVCTLAYVNSVLG